MSTEPIESDAHDQRVDRAILTYLEEVDAGRTPDPLEFLRRFPDVADDLMEFLADHHQVEQLANSFHSPRGSLTPLDATVDSTSGGRPEDGLPPPIGGYRPLRLLGAGGMGRVYEAEDVSGRRVALKLISPGVTASRTTLERFRQEGRLASRIAHPRCVFVFAADEQAGQPYIVMELMSGETLRDLVQRQGPLDPADAVAKVLDVIEGLEEAHQAGVIHRDVKPANCYLEADGRVKIGDFGLSRSLSANLHLTHTGAFVGTPLFASPEQLRGDPLDARTDVYSVATTLHYLLTGRAPFEFAKGTAVLAKIVSEPAPSPRRLRPQIPPAVEQVVLRGLERQRERRFQSLAEFREALLPLIPNQSSIAGLGLRVGAYLLDCIPFWVYSNFIRPFTAEGGLQPTLADYVIMIVPFLAYFWLTEGLCGCSLGKRMVRLRVTRAEDDEPPGLWRAFLRTAGLAITSGIPTDVFLLSFVNRTDYVTLVLVGCSGIALALGLRFSTMRARNGYRGFHEFLSGTRVVQLPPVHRRLALEKSGSVRAEGQATRLVSLTPETGPLPEGVPTQLGGFAVLGTLRSNAAGLLFLGEDAALGRPAWLWLRPRESGPLPPVRRDLARPTRLRWLAGGETGGYCWDAFVAPEGCELARLVSSDNRLSWRITRAVLEQLAEELETATMDGTLPAELTAAQVWVHGFGRVHLLDTPLTAELATSPEREHGASPALQVSDKPQESAERRSLALLAEVAILALEGRRRAAEDPPASLGAPLPLHARNLLERLLSVTRPYVRVAHARVDLAACRDRPAEVTPAHRVLQLALSFCFLSVGLFAMLSWSRVGAIGALGVLERQLVVGEATLRMLDDQSAESALLTDLPPDHPLRTEPRFAQQALLEQRTRDLQAFDQRMRSLGWMQPLFLVVPRFGNRQLLDGKEERLMLERQAGLPFQLVVHRPDVPDDSRILITMEELDKTLDRAKSNEDDLGNGAELFIPVLVMTGFFPLLWVGWAFLFRGGLGLRLAGLALVRSDGRDAGRFRSAWRALATWTPIFALFASVGYLDTYLPDQVWLIPILQGLGAFVVAGYVVAALRYPTRGPHDWLAGTAVVPR